MLVSMFSPFPNVNNQINQATNNRWDLCFLLRAVENVGFARQERVPFCERNAK